MASRFWCSHWPSGANRCSSCSTRAVLITSRSRWCVLCCFLRPSSLPSAAFSLVSAPISASTRCFGVHTLTQSLSVTLTTLTPTLELFWCSFLVHLFQFTLLAYVSYASIMFAVSSMYHRLCSLFHRSCSLFYRSCSLFHPSCSLFHRLCSLFHRLCSLFRCFHITFLVGW